VSSFAGIRSFFFRIVSIATGLALIAAVSAPSALPARGDAPVRLAVTMFQNQAAAPASVVNAMSASLYQSISSSPSYTATGGGPLPIKQDLIGGSFGPALDAAAKAGADEVVVGNIVQYANGQAYYSLSVYRVGSVMLVRTQVFTQSYPPSDAHAMTAAFASNIATLEAPRTPMGTIYSTYNGELDADLGTAEGFSLGQRFNVLRAGQKVAEANITQISGSFAVVTIVNASAGYKPAIGDRLVGLNAQPPINTPPGNGGSGFNPLVLLLTAGVALLAIGHGGAPAAANPQPTGTGTTGLFTVGGVQTTGTPLLPPITFVFTFTQPFNSTIFDPANQISLAYVQISSQGSTFLKLSTLGSVTYGPTPTAATTMTILAPGGVIQGTDHVAFTFLDGASNNWSDINGTLFTGVAFQPFVIIRHPSVVHARPHMPPTQPAPHPVHTPHP
jgi:hypothetical protein